jgi:hypothetical protein
VTLTPCATLESTVTSLKQSKGITISLNHTLPMARDATCFGDFRDINLSQRLAEKVRLKDSNRE